MTKSCLSSAVRGPPFRLLSLGREVRGRIISASSGGMHLSTCSSPPQGTGTVTLSTWPRVFSPQWDFSEERCTHHPLKFGDPAQWKDLSPLMSGQTSETFAQQDCETMDLVRIG